MLPVVLCVIYVLLAVVGDGGLALWAKSRLSVGWLLGAMALHAAASAAWAGAMRLGLGFGRSAVVLILANLAGAVLLGRFWFGEELTGRHVAGLVASAVAIALLA